MNFALPVLAAAAVFDARAFGGALAGVGVEDALAETDLL